MNRLKRCAECEQYTLKEEHCGEKTVSPHPPKYNPQDPYAEQRREAKRREGLL